MIEFGRIEGIEVVSFKIDHINALNVEKISPAIQKIFEIPYSKVIIDLGGVNYLDSTGFAMFLHLLRVARSNYCTFRLCCLTPHAMELFTMLQLDKALDIFPDRESCIVSYQQSDPF
jgi:anti-sigma B factor antagonist